MLVCAVYLQMLQGYAYTKGISVKDSTEKSDKQISIYGFQRYTSSGS